MRIAPAYIQRHSRQSIRPEEKKSRYTVRDGRQRRQRRTASVHSSLRH